MRDARQACHRRSLMRVGRRGDIQPEAGLDVNRAASRMITDLLQIVEAEKLDVILYRTAVRNGAAYGAQDQVLVGRVKFEEDVIALLEVWSGDQVEPVPRPRSRKLAKRSEFLETSQRR